MQGIHFDNTVFTIEDVAQRESLSYKVKVSDYGEAIDLLIEKLAKEVDTEQLSAIGHRIVHGGERFSEPCEIDQQVFDALHAIIPLAPEHLPNELQLVTELRNAFPGVKNIACFDTAFHGSLPDVARILPIPRKFASKGMRRYGFHGLAYENVLSQLEQLGLPRKSNVVMAHLGNGASLAAVRDGLSIDTSMGFSPTGGIPMSSRTGDIDPGIMSYLLNNERIEPVSLSNLINNESGLLGVSGVSSDMKKLLDVYDTDAMAAQAVDLFCYEVKKMIGAYAAVLDGVDALVFCGGIGEQAPKIRTKVCEGLEYLGLKLDRGLNDKNEQSIADKDAKIAVYVIRANESMAIAQNVKHIIQGNNA